MDKKRNIEENTRKEEEEIVQRKIYKFMKMDKSNAEVKTGGDEIAWITEEKESGNGCTITYQTMKGRPSVNTQIQGIITECLLDTGARINVMSNALFSRFDNATLTRSSDILKCANDSSLEVRGKTKLEVRIGKRTALVEFTVVEHITPELIGGIELQRQFGIKLVWADEPHLREIDGINTLKAKFGRNTTPEDRFKRAQQTLNMDASGPLTTIVQKYKNVFMADKWDIGARI